MKKLITLLAIVFAAYTINAQYCHSVFTATSDSTGLTTFVDQSFSQSGTIIGWFWDFSDGTSSTLQNPVHQFNASGTYVVCLTVMSSDSCTATSCDTLLIGNGQNPCAGFHMSATVVNASVPGAQDGSIYVTAWNGTPPYTYSWDNGPTTHYQNGIGAGIYCITIADNAGCTITDCFHVMIDSVNTNPCQIYVTGVVTNESYAGANDGAIDITATGGNPPYTYHWYGLGTTEDITGVGTGTYTVIVEDADSCSTTATYFVDVNGGNPTVWGSLFTNVVDSCINFIYDTVHVVNYTITNQNTISVTWAFYGSGQVAYITVDYTISQFGYNWLVLSVNCGTKSIQTYFDLVYVDNSITDINESSSFESFKLYPNPVQDKFNLEIQLTEYSNVNINIVNSFGQNVYQTQTKFNKGNNVLNINSEQFEYGVYLINVTTGSGKVITHRFVK